MSEKVFLVGSRKFADKLDHVFNLCKNAGIRVKKGRDSVKKLSSEEEKNAHKEMLNRIDNSDIIYIITEDGYIGRTVAFEVGYAVGKGKEIISTENIKEAGVSDFVSKILTPEEFLKYVNDYEGIVS
ncbi:MAG: hypothetical protein GF368_01895 [Candidatus Aenigmarchaeota archaeon]|nr:hypothetical protein [Candidatus Aenigmarchaeota archaeon]